MNHVAVTIQSIKDLHNGEGGNTLIKEFSAAGGKKEDITVVERLDVTIMEAGTVSGQTTLLFAMKDVNGEISYFELTAHIMTMLASTLLGAEKRFQDENEKFKNN